MDYITVVSPKEWGSAYINKVCEKLCFNVVQERLIVIVESVYPVLLFFVCGSFHF